MSEGWVPSEHGTERGGLQRRVTRGVTWTLIDTWGSQLLALAIFTILANLLDPVDFGLVALAAVFVALGQLLADQGLGDAVIQRKALTRRQLDTAFWAALLTGALLTVVGFVSADFIANVVGDPRLGPILQVLSIIFTLVALSSIQMGLMRRELDFKSLAVRKLLAIGIGGVVGIWMAYNDYGAWALVGQQVTAAAVTVVALWSISPWRPGFSFAREDFRSLFAFGVNVVGGDLLGFVSRNADNLLIGVFLGPTALGYYAIAYKILDTSQTLLVAAARRLVFPSFSRLQHDLERLRRAYQRLTRASGAMTLPGYVGLALVAQEAIVVLFGPRWAPSVPAAVLLFAIGPALTIQAFSGAVWNAVGHPEVTLRFRLIATTTSVIGFLIAVLVFGNIYAVAAAYTIRGYLLMPLNLYWMRVYSGISLRAQLEPLRGVAGATVIMAVAVLAVKFGLEGHVHTSVLLIAEVAAGVVAFVVGLWAMERALTRELTDVALQVIPGAERAAIRLGFRPHAIPIARPRSDEAMAADYVDDGA